MGRFSIDIRHWAQLSRLLDDALDRPAALRTVWIDTLGPEFDELKPELRRLLVNAALIESGGYLDTVPSLTLSPLDAIASPALHVGEIVGPYRLLRELGTGGMGDVWLAERSDGLIQRPVALKLPHVAWRRAGLARRLAREREILASLTHPNIARLYDVGVAADGQPFLAIEYVDGEKIDLYCRTHDLDIPARLRLIVQVSRAVAYAHSKLVVHRDLKPANILVTRDGQVHLLDFGIARLLNTSEGERLTELAGLALTPDYASPEQIRGELIGAGSDVYSLGVLTFELLTGERPYRLDRSSRAALEQAVLEADPRRPSEVAPASVRRQLRGDVDTIVLKAMKKDVSARYTSADAFADDIERHLESRPVLARRDSGWYRARKFVVRNRLALSATGAIALALVVGAVVAAWQARVALAQQERAEEVQTFIASVFREANPMMQGGGKSLSAVDLLLQAERRLDERADATPALRAEMLAIIGESLFGLQEMQQSARVTEKGLRIHGSMQDAEPLLGARLHLALSQAREYLGDLDSARSELAATFDALKLARNAGPLAVQARLHEAALGMSSDYAITERASLRAIDEATMVHGARSDEVAMALMFLSKAYLFTERMPQSVEPARQGLEILLANHQGDYGHPKLIDLAPYYANALIHTGEFDAAARLLRDLRSSAEHVFGADSRLLGDLTSIAVPAEMEIGNLEEAISLARRSRDIYLKEGAPDTEVHAYRVRLLSQTLVTARSDEALAAAEEAVRVSMNAKSPPGYGRASLGLALIQANRLDAADEQLGLALARLKPGTRPHMQASRYRAALLRQRGRSAEALPLLDRVIKDSGATPFDRPEFAAEHVERGLVLLELGKLDQAQESFSTATATLDQVQGDRMTPLRADLLIGQARLHLQRGDAAAALPDLERAATYWREHRPDSSWAEEADQWLARAHALQGTNRGSP